MDLFTWYTIKRRSAQRKKCAIAKKRPVKPATPKKIAPFIGKDGMWYINGQNTHIFAFPEDYERLKNKPTLNDEIIQGNLEALPLTLEEIQHIIEEVEDELEP